MKPQNSLNKERPLSRKNSLKVSKESHKIIKNAPLQIRRSRVIYSVQQRVINVTASHDFKVVDQRLSGNGQPTAPSEVSSAARLASTERTASKKRDRSSWSNEDDDMMRMLMSHFPGMVLSEPATLPPTPSDTFSPITWPATPTDAFSQVFPSGTRTPETLQQKQIGVFPSEFLSPEDGSPRSPQIRFNPFNHN